MSIQDSDPERRNLVVSSMAFIAYFYAGGGFADTTLRLQVINADFSRPEILGVIAWLMYFWFIYRYWVTHRGAFARAFTTEFSEWRTRPYITDYINRYFGQVLQPDTSTPEYHAGGMAWRGYCVEIMCTHAMVTRDGSGNVMRIAGIGNGQEHPPQYLQLTSLKGWMLGLRASISCMLKKPSFSGYIAPYVLVIVTFAGAAQRYFF